MELRKVVLGLGMTALWVTFVPTLEAGLPMADERQKAVAPAVSSEPSASSELVGFESEPILFLDNSPSDKGCCTIQKIKGTNTWECFSSTRKNCAETVKAAGLEREYQRWEFYKNQSCKSVLQCE